MSCRGRSFPQRVGVPCQKFVALQAAFMDCKFSNYNCMWIFNWWHCFTFSEGLSILCSTCDTACHHLPKRMYNNYFNFYFFLKIHLFNYTIQMMNDTGDQDLCYFNFLCAHPRWNFTDFNHIYSNLGYILLGILFHVSTAHRKFLRRKLSRENRDRLEEVIESYLVLSFHERQYHIVSIILKHYGIPQHYGLFYAMGTALLVHTCTVWVYFICTLTSNY
jgi:hypothetical protein